MSSGVNEAVQDGEDGAREQWAKEIAGVAAPFVASGEKDREGAIEIATGWARLCIQEDNDVTGMVGVGNTFPRPVNISSSEQCVAIAHELLPAAREAPDTLT